MGGSWGEGQGGAGCLPSCREGVDDSVIILFVFVWAAGFLARALCWTRMTSSTSGTVPTAARPGQAHVAVRLQAISSTSLSQRRRRFFARTRLPSKPRSFATYTKSTPLYLSHLCFLGWLD